MTDQQSNDLNSSLSSLAMLSVQLNTGKDYLDYLHGFVIEALKKVNSEGFDAPMVQKAVFEEFRLRIPTATFSIYLKRLAKSGIISPTATGVQFRVKDLPKTTITKDREVFQMRVKELTEELAGFAYRRYSLVWDDAISTQALTEFLRKYSIDCLRFADRKSPLPDKATDTQTTDFVVASFITACAKDHVGIFESIKVLVQSHILANALMCPDLGKTSKGFKDVHFLVDTRFMLKALDLESEYDTQNARQLLAAIRKLKGVICIFPETKVELRTVLRAIIKGMQQGAGHGPVCRELIKRGRGVAEVILADSDLDQLLTSLSISVLPSPQYDNSNYQFQIDESDLRDEIESEVEYITDKAAEHDIRVVRHIFALRKGRRVSSIEDSGYVLLTTNSALSRAAFHYEKNNTTGFFFSAVITDYHLSHLAWLKSPMEVPDLPRTEILASCYATMRPHESFWRDYLSKIERLEKEKKISQRDHEVLRFSINAADELMDVTRGEIEGITEKNLHIVLERLERTYAAEKEEKIRQVRREQDITKKELADLALAVRQSENEKAKAAEREKLHNDERIAYEAKLRALEEYKTRTEASEETRTQRVNRIAEWGSKAIFFISGLAFAVVGFLTFFSNHSNWFGVPAAIIGFFNLWCGFSGNTVQNAAKRWLTGQLLRFMK